MSKIFLFDTYIYVVTKIGVHHKRLKKRKKYAYYDAGKILTPKFTL
jgi:hypothetical protein